MSAVQTRSSATADLVRRWWQSRLGYRFLFELALVATLMASYKYVRFLARDATEPALANAERIIDLEKSLGADIEAGIQDLALNSRGFMEFINRYYVASHFAVTVTVMFWVYVRRPLVYARLRWVLFGITAMALLIHVAFPLAPPRMMSSTGVIDTLRAYGPSIYGSPDSGAANQFAAMPSLHFGYAALVAWAILLSFRSRWRYLGLTHPALMLFSIMATANHYWIDAAAAFLLLVVVGLVVWWLVNPVPDEADHDGDDGAPEPASADEADDTEAGSGAPEPAAVTATSTELIDA